MQHVKQPAAALGEMHNFTFFHVNKNDQRKLPIGYKPNVIDKLSWWFGF